MERRSSTQDGTDSTIRLLNSAEPVRAGKRGSADTVRAMQSVADDTRGRSKASFCSAGTAAPRSGGGHDTLRSTAAGISSEPATTALARNRVNVIPLPRLQLINSRPLDQQAIATPLIFPTGNWPPVWKRNQFLFPELELPASVQEPLFGRGNRNSVPKSGAKRCLSEPYF